MKSMQTINLEEAKEFYRQKIKFDSVNPPPSGGQTCGNIVNIQRLTCTELDLVIVCGNHRSAIENRRLLLVMFNALIDDLLK